MKKFFLLLSLSVALACSTKSQETVTTADAEASRKFMLSQCISCHLPNDGGAIGPSMLEIQTAYLKAYPDSNAFTEAIIDFLTHPKRENALLPEAVEKYGLMPAMGYNTDKLRDLASFLYKSNFNRTENPKKDSTQAALLAFADAAKQALGKNLMQALEKGGPTYAVDFCNTRAIPLTDSVANFHGLAIKRVSNKPRNPGNAASLAETQIMEILETRHTSGSDWTPMFTEADGLQKAFVPITTNAMCLKCHGTPNKEIAPETWAAIQFRYPGDQATGYAENQLRGLFVVEQIKE